jgi:hypothetical protein
VPKLSSEKQIEEKLEKKITEINTPGVEGRSDESGEEEKKEEGDETDEEEETDDEFDWFDREDQELVDQTYFTLVNKDRRRFEKGD